MNYYVIQVLTRSEEKFIRLANSLFLGKRRDPRDPTSPLRGGLLDSGVEWSEGESAEGAAGLYRSSRLPAGFSTDVPVGRLVWPRRRLTIRRKGKQQASLAPIFPGYVFYEADEIRPEVYWVLRQLSGFVRFLKNEGNLEALGGEDRQLLLHFLSYGEVVEKSLVYFDENRRIRVKSGPMKGLEGQIVKVDKRKGRAKVRLSMYSDRFLVDFGFELLESAEGNERQAQ